MNEPDGAADKEPTPIVFHDEFPWDRLNLSKVICLELFALIQK